MSEFEKMKCNASMRTFTRSGATKGKTHSPLHKPFETSDFGPSGRRPRSPSDHIIDEQTFPASSVGAEHCSEPRDLHVASGPGWTRPTGHNNRCPTMDYGQKKGRLRSSSEKSHEDPTSS